MKKLNKSSNMTLHKKKQNGSGKQNKTKEYSPYRDVIIFFSIGLIFVIGCPIFTIFYFGLFVPWQEFVCSWEEGTFEYDYDLERATYYYEIDGVEYKKIFTRNEQIRHGWPYSDTDTTIYVNKNDPTDVQPGNRGSITIKVADAGFFVMGVFFVCSSIYHFYQLKHPEKAKEKKKYKRR